MGASTKATSSSCSPAVPRSPLPALKAEFKVLLVGDSGVGKSALVNSHLTGDFARSRNQTASEEIVPLRFHTNCGDVCLNIWVVSRNGMESMHEREKLYLQGHAAIVMFDVTSRQSFRSVPNWQRELKAVLGIVPTVLLGNKVDASPRQVTDKQIQAHRRQHLQYYDVSVRDKHHFERPFLWLLRMLTNQTRLEFVGPFAKAPSKPPICQDSASAAARRKHEQHLLEASKKT